MLVSTRYIGALLSIRESDPCCQSGQEEAGTVTELLLQLWCCHTLTLLNEVMQNGLTNTPRALRRDKDISDKDISDNAPTCIGTRILVIMHQHVQGQGY